VIFDLTPIDRGRIAMLLTGRSYLLRPILPLRVFGPAGRVLVHSTLDTGSAVVVFPMSVASRIGVRDFVESAPLVGVGSSRSRPALARYAPVVLRLAEGREVCQWRAVVGFTDAAMTSDGLFGVAGGLEHFYTAIDHHAHQITLIPRVTLPVTDETNE
jgi:hypothetical protein